MNFSKTLFKFSIGLFLFGAVLTSCQEKDKKVETSEQDTPTEMSVDQKKQQLQMANPNSGTQQLTLPPGSVNPPHGEPGHRCEIPVGAPLDGSQPQKQMTVEPVKMPDMPPANPGNTGPKPATNPEHGQPWHRCDMKVGDPLP